MDAIDYSESYDSDGENSLTESEEIEYGEIEGYPKYEDIPIMTMTVLGYFDGEISDISTIFFNLLIGKIKIKKPTRVVKKITLPYPGTADIVLSARLCSYIRGIVRSITKGEWPHSIIIDISTEEKIVNCKLSRNNVHMTGCKSVKMAEEATKMLIDRVNRINQYIEFLEKITPEELNTIFQEVLNDGKGEYKLVNGVFKRKFNFLKIKSRDTDSVEMKCVRRLCFHTLSDIRLVSDARKKLAWLKTNKPVLEKPLTFSHINIGMVKYRFGIGYPINLQDLFDNFTIIDDEFYVDYFPDIRNYVKIEIPCQKLKPGKKEASKHTFNVQSSGQVTHSSPVMEEMRDVYYRFIYVINTIRELIEVN